MPQNEGKALAGRYALIEKAQIGMADPAAGDLHENLSRPGRFFPDFPDHRLLPLLNHPARDSQAVTLLELSKVPMALPQKVNRKSDTYYLYSFFPRVSSKKE
jgi:hypothetical protein